MRELDSRLTKHTDLLMKRYPSLEVAKEAIITAYSVMEECFENGGKLLIAGNGGSAADAEHIVGELMKSFKMPRKPNADFAKKTGCRRPRDGHSFSRESSGRSSCDCTGWSSGAIYCLYE